ncbi:MAG: DUF6569 family protein [Hyphomicrobiaceae bacterium]|nr:DUF6569 family protein [Hyphomicrobiaceae bacterium]
MSLRTLAVTLAGALAAVHLLALGARAQETRPMSPYISTPVVHENIALYFLRGQSAEGPVPLTLQEALSKGTVEVHETGSVRELRIENKGNEAVFVQLGDIVKGGRQDRVLQVSLLLQPNSGMVPIGAYCVERGRWSARGKEDARRFALSETMLPSREAKVAIARPASPSADTPMAGLTRAPRSPIEAELEGRRLRQAVDDLARRQDAEALMGRRHDGQQAQRVEQRTLGGSGRGDNQTEVWRSVDLVQQQLSANLAAPITSEQSRTSLQLSLENEKLKAALEAFVAALEPKAAQGDDVLGVAVAINGRIASADVYPSSGLFRKMWPKLVRAAATEAIASKGAGAAETPPTVEAVKAFLAEADGGMDSQRTVGAVGQIETREASKSLKVRAMAGAAAGARMVHESYLAK